MLFIITHRQNRERRR